MSQFKDSFRGAILKLFREDTVLQSLLGGSNKVHSVVIPQGREIENYYMVVSLLDGNSEILHDGGSGIFEALLEADMYGIAIAVLDGMENRLSDMLHGKALNPIHTDFPIRLSRCRFASSQDLFSSEVKRYRKVITFEMAYQVN